MRLTMMKKINYFYNKYITENLLCFIIIFLVLYLTRLYAEENLFNTGIRKILSYIWELHLHLIGGFIVVILYDYYNNQFHVDKLYARYNSWQGQYNRINDNLTIDIKETFTITILKRKDNLEMRIYNLHNSKEEWNGIYIIDKLDAVVQGIYSATGDHPYIGTHQLLCYPDENRIAIENHPINGTNSDNKFSIRKIQVKNPASN